MRYFIKYILICYIAASLVGCAMFQGNELSSMKQSGNGPITGTDKVMTYSINKKATMGFMSDHEDKLISAMKDYGWELRPIPSRDDGTPNMIVNLSLKLDPSTIIGAVITGLTFYTIPSWSTRDYKMIVEVNDAEHIGHYYEFRDHMTMVQWFPMIFAFPFAFPFSAEGILVDNMYTNLAYKINQDKIPVKLISKK